MFRYLVLICFVQYCSAFAVPEVKYAILFDSPIYPFGEGSDEYIDTSEVCVERVSESEAIMYGNMIFKKGMDEGTSMEICMQKEASGKFEMIFSHDICDFCAEVSDPESDYAKYLQYFGIPDHCPFDAGKYAIHNFSLNTDDFEVNSQHVGRYEAQLRVYKKTGEHCQNDRELTYTMKIDMLIETCEK